MKLGGWQRLSLIDYPERLSAVLFTQGCNFRCPYCHNPELVDPKRFQKPLPPEDVFSFLQTRQGKLDAVCITGGEPSIQPDLVSFMEEIKEMPYLIKLDTNGSHPEVLETLLGKRLVDYVAMDVKGPLSKYRRICKSPIKTAKIKESIELIMASGVDYEFRTTVVKSLLTKGDFKKIGALIRGATCYVLQRFVPSKPLDRSFMKETTYTDKDFEGLREKLEDDVHKVVVR
ncbi:MAG: anaerobic ribonucleoside-triphosphate reductase activating protein [Thermodesulfobacteriota bacterium]|nr:anaerobic ribonucleoside-triphosphate reductase activating protein [Thermodesulfobacteriota bacterium]